MKTAILALGALSLFLVASASANELDDTYQKLKDAQAAKDPDAVKKWAVETAKMAKAEATGPKLDGFSEEDWPKRVEYGTGRGPPNSCGAHSSVSSAPSARSGS